MEVGRTQSDSSQVGAIKLVGDIDEDPDGNGWAEGVSREWSEELQDSRQDIYTLEDGQPMNAPR